MADYERAVADNGNWVLQEDGTWGVGCGCCEEPCECDFEGPPRPAKSRNIKFGPFADFGCGGIPHMDGVTPTAYTLSPDIESLMNASPDGPGIFNLPQVTDLLGGSSFRSWGAIIGTTTVTTRQNGGDPADCTSGEISSDVVNVYAGITLYKASAAPGGQDHWMVWCLLGGPYTVQLRSGSFISPASDTLADVVDYMEQYGWQSSPGPSVSGVFFEMGVPFYSFDGCLCEDVPEGSSIKKTRFAGSFAITGACVNCPCDSLCDAMTNDMVSGTGGTLVITGMSGTTPSTNPPGPDRDCADVFTASGSYAISENGRGDLTEGGGGCYVGYYGALIPDFDYFYLFRFCDPASINDSCGAPFATNEWFFAFVLRRVISGNVYKTEVSGPATVSFHPTTGKIIASGTSNCDGPCDTSVSFSIS